jgi:hypothetical protein
MAGRFTPHLRSLLVANQHPFGEVFPAKENPPPLAIDGRTAALRVLREYVCNQIFYREAAPGLPPIPFVVTPDRFHIEQPDNNQDMTFPSIAVRPGADASFVAIGLGVYVEEETRDLYSPGTVLQWQSEYTEKIRLEINTAYKSERRGMLAALETALSPTELMYGLRFKMPEYYDELVCFSLFRRGIDPDDASAAINRRSAWLELEMRFNVVALVNYLPLAPSLVVHTDVIQPYGVSVDLDVDGENAHVIPGTD